MQGPRAQIDRALYKRHIQEIMFNHNSLEVREGSVEDLLIVTPSSSSPDCERSACLGVTLDGGEHVTGMSVEEEILD